MSVMETKPDSPPGTEAEWVRKEQAVAFFTDKGITTFNLETLKHYSYNTDLLPRPKVIGRHAYWRVQDLEKLLESL